jgi:hypothetical protein
MAFYEKVIKVKADVEAFPTAAFAPGQFGWQIVAILAVKWRAGNFLGTRLLVKVVHVLGTTEEAILEAVFKFGEGEVSRIRFGRRSHAPTHGIELPHQPGIAMPSLGR